MRFICKLLSVLDHAQGMEGGGGGGWGGRREEWVGRICIWKIMTAPNILNTDKLNRGSASQCLLDEKGVCVIRSIYNLRYQICALLPVRQFVRLKTRRCCLCGLLSKWVIFDGKRTVCIYYINV